MIRDQWYVVLQSGELKKGKPLGVLRMGEKMVFWRETSGNPVCQADLCPHRGAALSIGCLQSETIQCPFHGFEYDATGKCVLVPANGRAAPVPKVLNVKTYPCREAHGFIYIWWGDERENYPDLPWFDELDDSFYTSQLKDHWNVHYSRAIENQLDVFHLPFVHASTIGRGNRTITDGPLTKFDEKSLEIWVYSRVDDGKSTARRASELPDPARDAFLKFKFPHLWMNNISPDMRIIVFFTPIDEENCMIYLRNFQRFVRVPLLGQLMAALINPTSKFILYQDKRVVLTQRPKKTSRDMGEKLIPADKPIIDYRTIRDRLQKQKGIKGPAAGG
jgi:phenylpropionate dioxygenase-like ring-hydroxylating dioxygenase large terminal subunit